MDELTPILIGALVVGGGIYVLHNLASAPSSSDACEQARATAEKLQPGSGALAYTACKALGPIINAGKAAAGGITSAVKTIPVSVVDMVTGRGGKSCPDGYIARIDLTTEQRQQAAKRFGAWQGDCIKATDVVAPVVVKPASSTLAQQNPTRGPRGGVSVT